MDSEFSIRWVLRGNLLYTYDLLRLYYFVLFPEIPTLRNIHLEGSVPVTLIMEWDKCIDACFWHHTHDFYAIKSQQSFKFHVIMKIRIRFFCCNEEYYMRFIALLLKLIRFSLQLLYFVTLRDKSDQPRRLISIVFSDVSPNNFQVSLPWATLIASVISICNHLNTGVLLMI